MARKTPQQRLDEANRYLAEEHGIRIKLGREGYRLRIRVTLPPDASRGHERRQQYTVSLFLDASVAGIEQGKQDVIYLNWLLVGRKFTWKVWKEYLRQTNARRKIPQETAEKSVQRFKQHILAKPPKPRQKSGRKRDPEDVWKNDYAPYLSENRLEPWDKPVTAETIKKAIEKTQEGSAIRASLCLRLRQFVEFLNLDLDINFQELGEGYDLPPLKEGELPTDQEILDVHHSIADLRWRNAHGAQAAFGLRNSEVPLIDLSKIVKEIVNSITTYMIPVPDDSKTGFRWAFALRPEWVEEFELINAELPEIETEGKTLQWIGKQVTKEYKRMGVPYNPYMLRHAWAIRAILFGISVGTASLSMGHSEKTHTKHYWRFLDRDRIMQAFASALANSNQSRSPQRSDV